MTPADALIVILVVGARLLLPLGIVRYPLPAIVACLLLDGVDQTIFQTFTSVDLSGYQGYDKALDIYYLTIAYISTLRNWTNRNAVRIARFLLYYRLIGVALFEATGVRELMIIFPNTFEYFFIFYEAVRVRWNPRRMDARVLIGVTAFIWIFIKLPQEWWIHVAQLDMSDTLKRLLGGTPESDWVTLLAANPGVVLTVALAVIALLALAWWIVTRKLPPADRPITLDADAEARVAGRDALGRVFGIMQARYLDRELLEKVVLVSLLTVIFVLGFGFDIDPLRAGIGMTAIILANTAISEWLARRGWVWRAASIVRHFLAMAALNSGILVAFAILMPGRVEFERVGFVLALLTLIVTLYDRYRPEYLARFDAVSG